ncbi:hypothetical protein PG994_013658 [Apiospora phragmitis]|uniref:Uncharacterized protein n=1 Tax=Apiospora phragmitis TaxID=2905665 RepID=A0ABR1TB31_9PEZI
MAARPARHFSCSSAYARFSSPSSGATAQTSSQSRLAICVFAGFFLLFAVRQRILEAAQVHLERQVAGIVSVLGHHVRDGVLLDGRLEKRIVLYSPGTKTWRRRASTSLRHRLSSKGSARPISLKSSVGNFLNSPDAISPAWSDYHVGRKTVENNVKPLVLLILCHLT